MASQTCVTGNPHYDVRYFDLVRDCSQYSAVIDLFKFQDEVSPTDRLVDFGCGGGYMLSGLQAAEKIGIEVNESAASAAKQRGITILPQLDEIADNWADVIISHHALEHVDDPLTVVRTMKAKLKSGGKVVLVTPSESYKMSYRDEDPNFHLFTWSPSNLGNLLKRAGYSRIDAVPLHHRWPPYWWLLRQALSPKLMHALCVVHGRVRTGITQVKAVAYKP